MLRTNIKAPPRSRNSGFTLIEMVIGLSLSSIILAATLSAYTFLGRNLARLAGDQDQQSRSRRMMYLFSQDVSLATAVVAGDAISLKVALPAPTATLNPPTVTYRYDPTGQSLERTDPSGAKSQLDHLTNVTFSYYGGSSDQPINNNLISVKNICLSFTMAPLGTAANGTPFTAVSPRVLLRNKPLMGDLMPTYASVFPTPTP